MRHEKLVPDTSVIIEGMVSEKIRSKEIQPELILIHEAVLAELEWQANSNRTTGYLGLEEIKKLRSMQEEFNFKVHFSGNRPKGFEIENAKSGEIDAMIRNFAFEEGATLITADKVQSHVAEAKGIQTIKVKMAAKSTKLILETFFDETTMSVHLRENLEPRAKKGRPGEWTYTHVSETKLSRDDLIKISNEIIEEASIRKDGFIEIERQGSSIIQLGPYRIVITRPPFADGWEITAVRPVKRLNLEDYKLNEKVQDRIVNHAEGILIAGAPGQGKSTFAQAIAEFYALQNKVVKTVEAPRDLILSDDITQYSMSHGSLEEIHDILLLSRPDYTIFDEMRNTDDFRLFADLRLSGVGMIGIVHATNPIDAIQRFVGRIELGVIPQIIDTVLFIKNGAVDKVLQLKMIVKVPAGMTEADLARPVVVVADFITNKSEYELYSYGEETVVIPVSGAEEKSATHELAAKHIESFFKDYSSKVKVEVLPNNKCIVYVPDDAIAKIIGKGGGNIDQIEKKLGMSIEVQELKKGMSASSNTEEVHYDVEVSKKYVIFYLDEEYADKNMDLSHDGDYLLTAKVGYDSKIKIKNNNKIGKILMGAVNNREKIVFTPKN